MPKGRRGVGMEIHFANEKLRKRCSDPRQLEREYGQQARKIMQRLRDLAVAPALSDISRFPPTRCHPHKGNPPGRFTVDIGHPYRILFRVAHDPIPRTSDGGIDIGSVTAIEVIDVHYDPHG